MLLLRHASLAVDQTDLLALAHEFVNPMDGDKQDHLERFAFHVCGMAISADSAPVWVHCFGAVCFCKYLCTAIC